MGNWKKINEKSDLEGKVVIIKVDNKHECDDYYDAYWSDDNNRWEFIDKNCVTCRECNGEPTHYKLLNE